MNGLDVTIALAALSAVIGGYRLGLIARVASWVGLLGGLTLAAANMSGILRALGDPVPGKAGVQVAAVLFGAALVGKTVGMGVGRFIRSRLPGRPLKWADRSAGAALGLCGVAVVVWLVVPLLAVGPGWTAVQSRRSAVARAVDEHGPAQPAPLRRLRTWIAGVGGPFAEREPTPPEPGSGGSGSSGSSVPDGSAGRLIGETRDAVDEQIDEQIDGRVVTRLSESVVRVRAFACGYVESGTGFAVGAGRVLTNAHVVAGAKDVTVRSAAGEEEWSAEVVAFDPDRDLAVLEVPGLGVPAIPISVARAVGETGGIGAQKAGMPAAVVALSHGGNEVRAVPGTVRETLVAIGRDIYGQRRSRRDVLVLTTKLGPGDSGSPIFDPAGTLLGIAFAVAPDRPNTAYGLDRTELEAFLAESAPRRSSGPCLAPP